MRKKLPRSIVVIGFVSLFNDISTEMIYPLLPVFLTSVIHVGALELGVIEGLAESTASLLKMVSGAWTDRLQRRKPLVVAGYAFSSVFRPLIGLASTWPQVLVLRLLDRIGKGVRTSPRDALIADVTPLDQQGAAYGLHSAMDNAGSVAGPLLAAAVLLVPGMGLRQVFFFAAVPAVLTLALVSFGVKEERPEVPRTVRAQRGWARDWKLLGRDFRWLLVAVLLFTLGNSTDAFLLIRMSEAGITPGGLGLIWSGFHVVKMSSSLVGGKLSDQFGSRWTLLSGWIVYALVYLAFAHSSSNVMLVSVFLIYGLYFGLVEPSERALVARLAPPELRGTAFGCFHLTIGLGALPASLLFGWIWHRSGAPAAFTVGATLAFLGAFVLLLTGRDPARDSGSGKAPAVPGS